MQSLTAIDQAIIDTLMTVATENAYNNADRADASIMLAASTPHEYPEDCITNHPELNEFNFNLIR